MTRRALALPPSLRPADADYQRERYSVAQAALYLHVSVDVVYAEVAAGSIGHRRDEPKRTRSAPRVRKTSGRLHFAQSDLDAWRLARRHEPAGRATVEANRIEAIELPAVRRFS